MGTKKCNTCQETKPLEEFSKHRYSKDGHNWSCKACMSAYSKQYYKDNRRKVTEKRKEYINEYNHRPEVKERRREWEREKRKDPEFRRRRNERQRINRQKPEAKIKAQEYRKEYYSRPEVIARNREKQIERNFGSDAVEWYRNRLEEVNCCCEICGSPEEGRDLSIDHDHETGELRGLLCSKCNLMIGNAKDMPEILISGAEYLNQKKGSKV